MKSIQETMELRARAELVEAQVERSRGVEIEARLGATRFLAMIAPSCLLQPEVGDRVLVSRSARGSAVIAVIERGEGEACLKVGDGAGIRFEGAVIQLEATHIGVRASDALHLDAARTTIRARRLQLVADALTTAAGAVRTVAGTIDLVADQMTQYLGRSMRRVEREHLEAGDVTSRCTGIHETSGDAVVVVGRRVTKIDGGQVQIG